MTRRRLFSFKRDQQTALEICLVWVDRLFEMECRKDGRARRYYDITVMHSNGFREYCQAPSIRPLPWRPQ